MILSVVNHKGGSTKTTTTATLAVALAELGQRVLVCDLDSQASLTAMFRQDALEDQKTIYHALLERGTALASITVRVRDGVDLAPSDRNLAAGEVLLFDDDAGDLRLRRALAPLRDDYDYILLDCPPSLGKLTINSLAAADRAIIPVTCSFLTVKSLGQLLDTIEQVRKRLNTRLAIIGILLTRYTRTLHAAEVEQRVRDLFTDRVFETVVGQSIRFEEAPAAGLTILDYAPAHPGALAYRRLAQEILDHGQTRHAAASQ